MLKLETGQSLLEVYGGCQSRQQTAAIDHPAQGEDQQAASPQPEFK